VEQAAVEEAGGEQAPRLAGGDGARHVSAVQVEDVRLQVEEVAGSAR
jgi:hypothetical protein